MSLSLLFLFYDWSNNLICSAVLQHWQKGRQTITSCHLESPITRVFVKHSVQTNNTETWKVHATVPMWRESTGNYGFLQQGDSYAKYACIWWRYINKVNLTDLIAAAGLVIFKKKGTSSMLLQASCQPNWSCSLKTPNVVQNFWFFSRVTLKFDRWNRKTIGHLFYVISSTGHHFVAISEFKLD